MLATNIFYKNLSTTFKSSFYFFLFVLITVSLIFNFNSYYFMKSMKSDFEFLKKKVRDKERIIERERGGEREKGIEKMQ